MNLDLLPIIRGIYLLILLIMAGEVSSIFSKHGVKLLHTNDISNHIFIVCLIFFTLDYSKKKIEHPKNTLLNTLIIWLLYIAVSKQDKLFTIIIFVLFTFLYFLYDYMEYYKYKLKHNHDAEIIKYIESLNIIIQIFTYLLLIIIFIGFIKYMKFQKNIRKGRFNYSKFIFGSKI